MLLMFYNERENENVSKVHRWPLNGNETDKL
jgi:hypothetical protein